MTRVRIEGDLAAIPRDGPVIIAANHTSNLDAVVLGAWLTPALGRRIQWLGKKELFAWPVVGWAARNGGVHPVDRGAADVEAFRLAKRILDEGHVLFVFPEGTRSADGALHEARDGVAVLALRTGAPIVPVGIAGSNGVWPRGQKLPHPGGRVTVRVGEAVPARGRPAARHRPQDGQGPRDRRDHAAHRRAAAAGPARRVRGAERGPRAIIGPWEPCRTSASRSAPASATAFARRSTRPRSRRPPASRRTPSARSSTTRASSATSRTWASRPSRRSTTSTTAPRSSSAPTASARTCMARAEARGLEVIDGTCTWVIAEQRELRKLVDEGYTIVLLGTPNHPEVVGLLGFAPDAIVVDEEDEWDAAIPRRKKLALISQSHPAALEVREAGRDSWSRARTSSRSSTRSARSRSAARRTPSSWPARST